MPKADKEKHEHTASMIAKAQEHMEKLQAMIDGGEMSEEDIVEAQTSIQAMMEKIQRLTNRG